MKVFAIFAFLFAFIGDVRSDDVVKSHQASGAELFELVGSKSRFKLGSLDNEQELKEALSDRFCDRVRYQYYKLGNLIYVVGTSRRGVVIGRHFKVRVDGAWADVTVPQ